MVCKGLKELRIAERLEMLRSMFNVFRVYKLAV